MAKVSEAALRLLRRVLSSEENGYDGYASHGAGEHATMRVLNRRALVKYDGDGVCAGDCDNVRHQREPTDVPIFRVTPEGRTLLGATLREGVMANPCIDCGSKRAPCECEEQQRWIDEAVAAERARIAAEIRAMREEYFEGASMDGVFARLLRVVEGG